MANEISLKEADENVVSALYRSAVEGNVQAQIFWLTNRMPSRWNRTPVQAEKGDTETGVVLIPTLAQE